MGKMVKNSSDKLMAVVMLCVSSILIFLAFIDFRTKHNIFQVGLPMIKDWIMIFFALIALALSLSYIIPLIKEGGYFKGNLKKRLIQEIKLEHKFFALVIVYILILIVSFYDFSIGKPILKSFAFDPHLYKDEDILIAILAVFGIIKFSLDYIRIKKKVDKDKIK